MAKSKSSLPNFKPLHIAILAFIILFVGVAGYYFGYAKSTAHLTNTAETNNWKTFVYQKYGFSFQYPTNWSLNTEASAGRIAYIQNSPGQLPDINSANIFFAYNPTSETSIENYYNSLKYESMANETVSNKAFISVNGQEAVQFNLKDSQNHFSENTQFIKDGYVYTISLSTMSESAMIQNLDTYHKVISSFKFTN